MTEVTDAETLIARHMPQWPARREPLAACTFRVLAEDVTAERDQPPFDRVTMDGIAVAYGDFAAGTRSFAVIGVQAAGAPPLAVDGPGECVRVMTGTPLPRGVDTVIPIERVALEGAMAVVAPDAAVADRQFVHPRASDRAAGSVVLAKGARLGPPEIAVLAGAGRADAAVAALPKIAVVSTGDELVDVGMPLAAHQIRSTNDRAIEASLHGHRLATVTRVHLADDANALAVAIDRLDAELDGLVLSGGVSAGEFDFVPAVLAKLGAKLVFHRVEQRPGKPMWFGVSARGKPIFALPGNPVSTLVCATRYLVPALRRAAGLGPAPVERVCLSAPVEPSATLTYFVPVKLSSSSEGVTLAEPCPTNTSGDFVSLAGTDGFVELPAKRGAYAAGAAARLHRW